MPKFFKKEIPRTPIYMPNGDIVVFETIDGVTGYYSTDNPVYLTGFQKMIESRRGGVSEIDQTEFETNFSKKKLTSTPSVKPPWREEISGGPLHDTVMSRQAVAAVNPPKAPPTSGTTSTVAAVDTGKPVTPPAKPRIGKRPAPE